MILKQFAQAYSRGFAKLYGKGVAHSVSLFDEVCMGFSDRVAAAHTIGVNLDEEPSCLLW